TERHVSTYTDQAVIYDVVNINPKPINKGPTYSHSALNRYRVPSLSAQPVPRTFTQRLTGTAYLHSALNRE
ncbi:hypothetical protein GCK32_012945, partial [Trichostrongylus colubriformis]